MTEYEWEPRRVPRPTKTEFLANYHPHVREVAEFAALEHPREHVGWLLKQHSEAKIRQRPQRWYRKAWSARETAANRSKPRE
jgi:hypothetical protein